MPREPSLQPVHPPAAPPPPLPQLLPPLPRPAGHLRGGAAAVAGGCARLRHRQPRHRALLAAANPRCTARRARPHACPLHPPACPPAAPSRRRPAPQVYILNACQAGERLQASLRTEAFRCLLAQRLEFFDRHSSQQLTALLTRDLDSIRAFVFANTARDRGLRALLEAVGSVGVLFVLRCGRGAAGLGAGGRPTTLLRSSQPAGVHTTRQRRRLPLPSSRPPTHPPNPRQAAGGWARCWRA